MVIVLRIICKLPTTTGCRLSVEFKHSEVCRTNADQLKDKRKQLITRWLMFCAMTQEAPADFPVMA
jgi:hypothetical protein